MLCQTCRFTERPGFVRLNDPNQIAQFVPCPDCDGQSIAHCCDGVCEQPYSPTAMSTSSSAHSKCGDNHSIQGSEMRRSHVDKRSNRYAARQNVSDTHDHKRDAPVRQVKSQRGDISTAKPKLDRSPED